MSWKHRVRSGAAALGALLLGAPTAGAATAAFREGTAGYAGTADTYIDSSTPDSTYGSSPTIRCDNNGPIQALLRFDNLFGAGPGQIPWGSTINSAAITVEVSDQAATGATITVHRVLIPWSESSTWNTLAAGVATDDIDALAVPDTVVVDPNALGPQVVTGLAASVQAWSGGSPNHGWVFISDQNNDWAFLSSENAATTMRPLLTVDYTPAHFLAGRVFEDADFAGTATGWDGGVTDRGLGDVDVELYTSADAYVASATTDASGTFTFWGIADGGYKVRVRSGTIGDSNTPPAGGFVVACGITDPASGPACVLPELVWSNGTALYGGQDPVADDTDTGDDAGPGDTWAPVTVAGAPVTGLDFGFAYNAIVNVEDGGQGSLRRFLENANAIGSAGGTTANAAQLRFRVPANRSAGGDSWWRVTPSSALPALTDGGTTLDASTHRVNSGVDSNTRGPELEIHGNGLAAAGLEIADSADHVIRELVVNGFAGDGILIAGAGADRVGVRGCHVGTDAVGESAVPNTNGITLAGGADAVIGSAAAADRNLVSGNGADGIRIAGAVRRAIVRGNSVGVGRTGSETALGNGGDGIRVASTDDPSQVVIGGTGTGEGNVVARNGGDGVESQGSGSGDEIAGNVIRHNAGGGVVAATAGLRVVGNVVWSNGGGGNAGLRIAANGVTAYHNTIHGGGADGIVVDAGGAVVRNNLSTGNAGFGLRVVSGSPAESDNGITGSATNPPNALGRSNTALDPSDLDVDPQYVNPPVGDFRLTECTSLAINTGVDLGAEQPDLNGGAPGSYEGPAPDMGARETGCAAQPLQLVKRGFLTDGTPVAHGTTLPRGTLVDFLLYLNNPGPARVDASVRDVLEPGFAYVAGSTRIDTTSANCVGGSCTPAEEQGLWAVADARPAATDAVDGDLASYDAPGTSIDVGDGNVANARLDLPANSVTALLIRVRVQ